MKARMGLVLGATLLAAGLATPAHATASAPTSQRIQEGVTIIERDGGAHNCPDFKVCLYENSRYNVPNYGRILITDQSISDLGAYGFDNVTSGVINNTNNHALVYDEKDYEGELVYHFWPRTSMDFGYGPESKRASSLLIAQPN
ncbi:peptidase inhibitor family I36 protein [Streptomyces niveus]|uniref:peptidase inhibitor family I36 protein n=1 Tax=Streptomyces niveus TaxID=193462 RepID=UPI0035DA34D6